MSVVDNVPMDRDVCRGELQSQMGLAASQSGVLHLKAPRLTLSVPGRHLKARLGSLKVLNRVRGGISNVGALGGGVLQQLPCLGARWPVGPGEAPAVTQTAQGGGSCQMQHPPACSLREASQISKKSAKSPRDHPDEPGPEHVSCISRRRNLKAAYRIPESSRRDSSPRARRGVRDIRLPGCPEAVAPRRAE